jgi:electron transfer flavoprotein beta subunit
MGLNMAVLVKQVPDTTQVGEKAMKEDGTVNRDALPAIVNPDDLHALEQALRTREVLGGRITVVSMGPPKAAEALRECFFLGADEAVLVSDKSFAASDTLATSYILARTLETVQGVEVVFCGKQAIDGDTAQVGPQLAEKLGLNQITNVTGVLEVDERGMTVLRGIEGGEQKLRSRFPLLLTVSQEANEPRPPSAKKVMACKKLPSLGPEEYALAEGEAPCIRLWNAGTIEADPALCGMSGSATQVKQVRNVVLKAQEVKRVENTHQAITGLMAELHQEHILA